MKIAFIILAITCAVALLRPTRPSQTTRRDAWILLGCFVISIVVAYFS